jgi:hypothetical protein
MFQTESSRFNRAVKAGYLLIVVLTIAADCSIKAESSPIYEFSPYASSLSPEDLAHGDKQVEQMITDRPEMAKYIQHGDEIWIWLARQFAGEFIGARINWMNYPPQVGTSFIEPDYSSFYIPPHRGQPGYITVNTAKNGHNVDGEQMWAKAIFELFNIRNSAACVDIGRRVLDHKLSNEGFVREITKLEYAALKKSVLFYTDVWRPESEKKGIKTHDYYWQSPAPATYAEWMSQFTNIDSYPWSVYNKLYSRIRMGAVDGLNDKIIVPTFR